MRRHELRLELQKLFPGVEIVLTLAPDAKWGEFSSNLPVLGAKMLGRTPESIAQTVQGALGEFWPGPIQFSGAKLNFYMNDAAFLDALQRATREGAHFGATDALSGQKILVEYVSSDPGGPLPFGAGRAAAMGEAICRLLELSGARVTREFYLNDLSNSSKVRLLGESVAFWYGRAFGQGQKAPEGASDSAFVRGVAGELARRDGGKWLSSPPDERLEACSQSALEAAIESQRASLERFGTRFDAWVSESNLHRDGWVEKILARLTETGALYERDGAKWVATSRFGDETDRVLVRSDGRATYFAGDLAYHFWKSQRGFDAVLNLWEAGHQPYIARTKAALQAAHLETEKFEFLTVEGAVLARDGAPIRLGMSGGPLLLDEETEELGADALKWFFTAKSAQKTADVDLEIATRDDESNQAYAAQLLPSRLAMMRREVEGLLSQNESPSEEWAPGERELARLVALWPDCAQNAAQNRAPEKVAEFVSQMARATRELLRQSVASQLPATRRLELLRGAGIAATAALKILGIEARERF